MSYIVRKKRNEQCFCVKHAQTGDIHSEHATRKAALAQLRQLSVGGMPKPTPFVPRHGLFRSPRPSTPEYVPIPAPTMSQAERDQALDALAPSLSGLLYPPARAPIPAPSASTSSASSFQSPHRRPAVILLNSDVKEILDNFKATRAIPEQLKAIYSALSTLGIGSDTKRLLYASAMYNLGYASKRQVYEVNTGKQMRALIAHIDSNLKTIIPKTRGGAKGVRGKNLRQAKLFGTTVTDSGVRIPAPKMKMDLKEFHAIEGVNRPGHPRYNVFPEYVARAKKAFKGTEDAHEDALFKIDMAKLKRKKNKWTGGPSPYGDTSTVPLAEMKRRSATIGRERPDTFEV